MADFFDLQLFGGGGGSSPEPIKKSASGSMTAATIEQATEGQRQRMQEKLRKGFGRGNTITSAGNTGITADSIKKALLGE